MITAEPYLNEWQLYHMVPQPDRWIFNKLIIAERMGYTCGPVNTVPPSRGEYIVRPIMNVTGMGNGGFYIVDTVPQVSRAITKDDAPNNNPGYFWSEVFTGNQNWTSYIDDVATYSTIGTRNGNSLTFQDDPTLSDIIQLPDMFKGISKYMMLEHIGGNVIEIGPRHTGMYARQETIDGYRLIDPSYDPIDIHFGLADWELTDDPAGGKRWSEVAGTRRPF